MGIGTEKQILIIDNNADHVQIAEQVFADDTVQVIAIANGLQALDYLHQKGNYTEAARPDLVLLDLQLSDQTGWDILAGIKADEQLWQIPIVVLTVSEDPVDILQSYTLQGNCYVVKTSEPGQLAKIIQQIKEFWLEIVTLPRELK